MTAQIAPIHMDDTQFQDFTRNFFGFGNWEAPCWLLAFEEKGAKMPGDFRHKFTAWNKLKEGIRLLDLTTFHTHAKTEINWNCPTWTHWHTLLQHAALDFPIAPLTHANRQWGGIINANESIALLEAMPFPAGSRRD